jgi:hypothetical protein
MQLSPTVRWLLTGLFGGLTVLATQLPALTGLPEWVGPALAALTAVGAALGLIPPQTGGTQQGVVNPSVTEPPAADVGGRYPRQDTTGFSEGAIAFWPVAAWPVAADRVSEGEALFWIAILLIVGFLVAAGVAAFRYANWIASALLLLCAIVTGVLLL